MIAQPAIDTRLHPLQAMKAVRNLLNDPEDTTQVFIILRAMRGRSGQKVLRQFRQSATGRTILNERRSLLAALDDRPALSALPQGSLGRAYLEFMLAEDLSAGGLVAPSSLWKEDGLPPEAVLFRERMRDMHDLTHVLTGYGRDGLGELCLLAFMHAHNKNLGQAMIVLMGLAKASRGPHGPAVRKAIVQAWRHGRKARWFVDLDWEAMLPQPLDALRRDLNIGPPGRYAAVAA